MVICNYCISVCNSMVAGGHDKGTNFTWLDHIAGAVTALFPVHASCAAPLSGVGALTLYNLTELGDSANSTQ
jgi:hypothetical protein